MRVAGAVLALPFTDVDTDQIIPASHLTVVSPEGLGQFLFDGQPELLRRLNAVPDARVLVALENFGCGSSREHAVWAIQQRGFQAVIAPSFSRIFLENAYNNGLAPVALPADLVRGCLASAHLELDFVCKTLRLPDGTQHAFAVDPVRELFLESGGYLRFLHSKILAVREWQCATQTGGA
jgi:3-isopropylmalate/(R)-2-methylmalate dehydratase small subunit